MSAWQPVETAPKDETDVLICGGWYGCDHIGNEISKLPFKEVAIAYYDDEDKEWKGADLYFYHPTHWQRIPKPIGEIK